MLQKEVNSVSLGVRKCSAKAARRGQKPQEIKDAKRQHIYESHNR